MRLTSLQRFLIGLSSHRHIRQGRARRQAANPPKPPEILSLSLCLTGAHAHAQLCPLSQRRLRCAHSHMHTPTGQHNHGEHSIPQVLVMQANEGKSLTHSLTLQWVGHRWPLEKRQAEQTNLNLKPHGGTMRSLQGEFKGSGRTTLYICGAVVSSNQRLLEYMEEIWNPFCISTHQFSSWAPDESGKKRNYGHVPQRTCQGILEATDQMHPHMTSRARPFTSPTLLRLQLQGACQPQPRATFFTWAHGPNHLGL